jgi:hypothetical protein
MGARDAIAKLLVGAKRTDLPTRAYHGTNKTFEAFENQPVGYMLDRGLGTHVAADPALASSFADRWIKDKGPDYFSRWTKEVKGEPQILPLRIPAEDKFLPAVQHPYSYRTPEHAPWQAIDHDEYAIERMMSEAAYRKDPDMLARYLVEARSCGVRPITGGGRQPGRCHRGQAAQSDRVRS